MMWEHLLQYKKEIHRKHFSTHAISTKRKECGKRNKRTMLRFFGNKSLFVFVISIFIILVGCEQKTARTIDMYNVSGDMVGTVKLTEEADGVKAKVKVEGVSSGFHGIHIHEFPKCKGPDFKSAGNHLNPQEKEHGLMNSKGAHLGDLPNIKAGSDGEMKGEVTIIDATLLDGKNSLLKGEGTSIVITKGRDDGMTQPSGDSGNRIICGTITKNPKQDKKSPSDPTESE